MPDAIAIMFLTDPHNWMPIRSLVWRSFNVSPGRVCKTKFLVLALFAAKARATGSLLAISIANVGPEITAMFFVLSFFWTMLESKSRELSSNPLAAIHTGILVL